ncbi:hypothetical protein [Streptomyces sp. NPDC050546]|uniref:hypothetical protein n=1 Tax=Streptomyces sp. NPDC050546 TaxID=3365628 RepID=UPI00379BB9E7
MKPYYDQARRMLAWFEVNSAPTKENRSVSGVELGRRRVPNIMTEGHPSPSEASAAAA